MGRPSLHLVSTNLDRPNSISFATQNPLILPLRVNSIKSTASLNGTDLASFTMNFDNFVTPPLGTGNSGNIPNVVPTQGITASLAFVPEGILDVSAVINLEYAFLLFLTLC